MPLLDTASVEEETDAVLRAACDNARREAFESSSAFFIPSATTVLEWVFDGIPVSASSEIFTGDKVVDRAIDCPPWIIVKDGSA